MKVYGAFHSHQVPYLPTRPAICPVGSGGYQTNVISTTFPSIARSNENTRCWRRFEITFWWLHLGQYFWCPQEEPEVSSSITAGVVRSFGVSESGSCLQQLLLRTQSPDTHSHCAVVLPHFILMARAKRNGKRSDAHQPAWLASARKIYAKVRSEERPEQPIGCHFTVIAGDFEAPLCRAGVCILVDQ